MDDIRSLVERSLGGNYRFERELGGGGMSRTYLATETALDRRVVVKVLAPELLAGISVERFRREVLLAARLQHPHVVPVLTTGEVDGIPWFTMPYVDGDSLRQRLSSGALPVGEAISVLRDVARALASWPAPGPVMVFDDATGAPVDAPPRPEHAALLARAGGDAPSAPKPAPGRPRLGVVAREVTLLPRHWQWLAAQRGGASATLRRLIDQARKTNEKADAQRQAREKSYQFMSAIAGHQPGFEEAARALFAGDGLAFTVHTAAWPDDVRAHLAELARGAFDPSAGEKARG